MRQEVTGVTGTHGLQNRHRSCAEVIVRVVPGVVAEGDEAYHHSST
jgi:hypothetical protein